ncbi:MAG TPA: hypothetical protein VN222_02215, partial [Novosphingobium sp.]|nr:hypothetical protein [Novosphingobium sp.]
MTQPEPPGNTAPVQSAPAAEVPVSDDAELRALIPDAAVASPDAWAQAAHPMPATANAAAAAVPAADAPPSAQVPAADTADQGALNPDSPLAETGFTLPWPDAQFELPALPTITPDADADKALADAAAEARDAAGGVQRGPAVKAQVASDTSIAGGHMVLAWADDASAFPDKDAFETRFRSLSALATASTKEQDALGQIAVRAASDRVLLQKLMRVYGYYDGEVLQTLSGPAPGQSAASGTSAGPQDVRVRFDLLPAERYKLGEVRLGHLSETGADYPALRKSFALNTG